MEKILEALKPFAPAIEGLLKNLEANEIDPLLQKWVDDISSPDLKRLAARLKTAVVGFIQDETDQLS